MWPKYSLTFSTNPRSHPFYLSFFTQPYSLFLRMYLFAIPFPKLLFLFYRNFPWLLRVWFSKNSIFNLIDSLFKSLALQMITFFKNPKEGLLQKVNLDNFQFFQSKLALLNFIPSFKCRCDLDLIIIHICKPKWKSPSFSLSSSSPHSPHHSMKSEPSSKTTSVLNHHSKSSSHKSTNKFKNSSK